MDKSPLAILFFGLVLAAVPSWAQSAESTDEESASTPTEVVETTDYDAIEDIDDAIVELTREDRIRAVSRKKFLKRGRFSGMPTLATSVNDAFFQHFNVGARFSYHIVDSLAIEVGGAWNFLTVELPSVEIVKLQQTAIPEEATLFGNLDIGLTFSPFYGKLAVLDDWIIHFDGFVSGGAGVVIDSNRYYDQVLPGLADSLPGFNPALELGVGGRIFVTEWLVVRGELRDYLYPQWRTGISTMQNLLMASVGVEVYVPFGFDFEYVAARVVD